MSLSKRLMAIYNLILPNNFVADIGTDHAYLPIELLRNGVTDKVIASDIAKQPLNIAKQNIYDSGFSDAIEIVLSNGIENLVNYNINQYVIAGMGGLTIIDILKIALEDRYIGRDFILQPMNSKYTLRKWLCEHKFEIIEEYVVSEEHKFYTVIYARRIAEKFEITNMALKLGVNVVVDDDYISYLEKEIQKNTKILDSLSKSNTVMTQKIKRYEEYNNQCRKIISDNCI